MIDQTSLASLLNLISTELAAATNLGVAEWLGCLTGVAGSALLALNNRFSGFGFVLFMVSNLCWIAYALTNGIFGLVTMQVAFTVTSGIGIYRWLLRPPRRLSNELCMVRL